MEWLRAGAVVVGVALALAVMMLVFWQVLRKISCGVPVQVSGILALVEQ